MKHLLAMLCFCCSIGPLATPALAEVIMRDTFDEAPQERWQFFTDTVMGGVSTGQVAFLPENAKTYARLTGTVSTENRGGFIQMRSTLTENLPDSAEGVRLITRGNGQTYFVHLRTSGTLLPWQYYQGSFEAEQNWTEQRIPFSAFTASGRLLRSELAAETVKSIGIVAYGRNHQAEVEVLEVGFY